MMTDVLREMTWASLVAEMKHVSEELQSVLKALLGDDGRAWVAKYSYGELIVENGSFVAPSSITPLEKMRFEKAVGQNPPPLCLVLENSVEVFLPKMLPVKQHGQIHFVVEGTFPLQVIPYGKMFGVFEALDRRYIADSLPGSYSVSSGCRSIWILNSAWEGIASALSKRLAIGEISWEKGKQPHYELVQEAMKEKTRWRSTILVLPESLVKKASTNSEFERFMFKLGWVQSSSGRRKMIAYQHHQHLSHEEKLLKNRPEYRGLTQHLESIQFGELPAFCLTQAAFTKSTDVDLGGPFEGFQNEMWSHLQEKYSKQYYPFIMQPWQLDSKGKTGFFSFTEKVPFLLPPNSWIGGRHCQELTDGHTWPSGYEFFWNKPQRKDQTEAGLKKHYAIRLRDLLPKDRIGYLNNKLKISLSMDHVCLTDGFLNAGVMIRR